MFGAGGDFDTRGDPAAGASGIGAWVQDVWECDGRVGYSPKDGYLAFEYVEDPVCDGECFSGGGRAVVGGRWRIVDERKVGEV